MNMSTLPFGLFGFFRSCGLRLGLAGLASCSLPVIAYGQAPPKPGFQYELDDVRVSIPSADEPRVTSFGPESLRAASKYLETGAVSWVRGRSCVNCHTTGPYMTEFTAWSQQFGPPSEEVHASFVKAVPPETPEVEETDANGSQVSSGRDLQRVA